MSWNRVSWRLIMANRKTITGSLNCFYLLLVLTYPWCDWTLGFVCVLMKLPFRTACLIVLWGLSHFWLSSLSILVIKSFFFQFTIFWNFNRVLPFITSQYEFILSYFDQLRTLFEIIVIVLFWFAYFLTNE